MRQILACVFAASAAGAEPVVYIDDVWLTTADRVRYSESYTNSSFDRVGTAQGWSADDAVWRLDLPSEFPFYDGVYTQCWVDSNGRLLFRQEPSDFNATESVFLNTPGICVLWSDLRTDWYVNPPEDVFIESHPESGTVTVRWQAEAWWDAVAVNVSVQLSADGTIRLQYGSGNERGGRIGISAGDGLRYVQSARSNSGSMDAAGDIVFTPVRDCVPATGVKAWGLAADDTFDVEALVDLVRADWAAIYRYTGGYGCGYGYGCGALYSAAFGYGYGFDGSVYGPVLLWTGSHTNSDNRLFYRVKKWW